MKVITSNNLGKKYILRQERRLLVRDLADLILRPKKKTPDFFALKNVSFDVEKGKTFGIIGENGSGKSTLLKIISGVTKQTEGELEIKGSVAALLELGAGFHPYLTGRENVYLNGSIIGLKKNEITRIFDDIVAFAEIEDFIDVAVKNYSSGMFVRLGFAIAVNLDPDILIIDEVLSVGDEAFQRKCFQKINEFKDRGKTIILVTHDMNAVSSLCDRVLLLKKGRVLKQGKVGGVVQLYLSSVGEKRGVAIISKNDLTLIFNNGKLSLFFKEIGITQSYGGYSAIFTNSMWDESIKAIWEIIESSDDYIKCSGKFRNLPLKQIWEIKILDQKTVEIKISLEIIEKCILEESHVSFLLSDEYKQWFSEIETGEFPDITAQDREWIHLNKKNHPSEFFGVQGHKNSENSLPAVAVVFKDMEKNYIATVLNSDCTLKSRVLQWLRILTKTEKNIEPGMIKNFMTCMVNILENAELSNKFLANVNLQDKIQTNKLGMKFDAGNLKIFHEEKELTSGDGFFMSVYSEEFRHDSMQSIYDSEKISESEISIRGKFRRLPVSFLWNAKIIHENKLILDMKLDLHHKIEIDKVSFTLVLNRDYSGCRISGNELKFPDTEKDKNKPGKSEELLTPETSEVVIYHENTTDVKIPKLVLELHTDKNDYSIGFPETDFNTGDKIMRFEKDLSTLSQISEPGIVSIGRFSIEVQL